MEKMITVKQFYKDLYGEDAPHNFTNSSTLHIFGFAEAYAQKVLEEANNASDKMQFLAFDGVNQEHENFNTPEECEEYLNEIMIEDETLKEGAEDCAIYKQYSHVKVDVVDKKSNYKYEREEDIPDDDSESEAWPYDRGFDEIVQHKFIKNR